MYRDENLPSPGEKKKRDENLPVLQKVSAKCICIHNQGICELLAPESIAFVNICSLKLSKTQKENKIKEAYYRKASLTF